MKSVLTTFFLSIALLVSGQNLVPNPSFEKLYKCPNDHTRWYTEFDTMIYDWKIPSLGSPDIHTTCTSDSSISVPFDYKELLFGKRCYSYQQPHSGNNFLELANSSSGYKNGDFAQVKLIDSLVAGSVYRVAFYISVNDCSGYYSDGAGMYLSKEKPENYNIIISPQDSCHRTICPKLTPQVKWKGDIIRDTTNWTLIEGYYKATGGEQWLTIGSFHHANSKIDSISQYPLWIYLDDVSVEFSYSLETNKDTICVCDSIQIQITDRDQHFLSFSKDGSSPLLGNELSLKLCSSQWLYYFRNNRLSDSLYIHSKKKNDPFDLPKVICPDSFTTLHLPHFDSTDYFLDNKKLETNPALLRLPNAHTLKSSSHYFCTLDTFFQTHTPHFTEGFDSTFCIDESPAIALFTQNSFETYEWLPHNHTADALWVSENGNYVLIAEDSNHCLHTFNFEVQIICEPKVWIPNAFSPNSSPGVNDLFEVKTEYLSSYSLTIYNRWGQQIFTSTDPTKMWDGTFNHAFCEQGVYFYLFEGTGITPGIQISKSGSIHLVR